MTRMDARTPLIAGNWKMNKLPSQAGAWLGSFIEALDGMPPAACDVLLNVPYTHLPGMAAVPQRDVVSLGAQDLSAHDEGAYTGEVSGAMLADVGARYVIVGHSERRAYHHEDDALVGRKLEAALRSSLVPILCVGESEAEREAGDAERVVLRQLDAALRDVDAPDGEPGLVLAYEPVWAIGTGKTATADDAQAMCATIRAALERRFPSHGARVRVLYGGSMKPSNAAELLAKPDVDGCLIGGASLDADQLLAIGRAAGAGGTK